MYSLHLAMSTSDPQGAISYLIQSLSLRWTFTNNHENCIFGSFNQNLESQRVKSNICKF